MGIDEAGNHAAAARVDARRPRQHVHVLLQFRRWPDEDDDALMRGDDRLADRRDVPLRNPPARRGPGARGDGRSVLNEEVGWLHGRR